jgi:hypothetical protein
MLEERAPRNVYGPKRDEVTEEWRRLHKEYLNNLYPSSAVTGAIKSATIRARNSERMRNTRKVYTVLVGKPETVV